MKLKFRLSGRGGQGIKFFGSALVRVAMEANFYATLSVDYTPSVRGGPIFCDVILSSEQISYPFCDEDADIFIVLDQKGFERASECICEKTISFVDSNTVNNADAEKVIQRGIIHRVPITKYADDNEITKTVNMLSLGFLSEYLSENGKINLKEEHYFQVFNNIPNRDINIRSFQVGKTLYKECSLN